mmetsp:Transcript_57822/g.161397  ORF Transcript_57822/g.161397 Transcript_57822/m.161397 type:complete len:174 (-) Transcript_57822:53-574(-)
MRHIALLLLFGVAGGARRRQMGEVTDEVANTKTVASAEHMLDNRPLQYFGRPAGEGAAGSATKPQEVPPVTMAPDASASRAMADAPRRGRHNEWFASLSELGSRVRSTAMDIQRSRFDQVLILTVACVTICGCLCCFVRVRQIGTLRRRQLLSPSQPARTPSSDSLNSEATAS